DVARVGHLLEEEGFDVQRGVVSAQQPRALPDGAGAEARSGPVGDAAVEGDAGDGDVAAPDLLQRRQAGEGGWTGETGHLARGQRAAGQGRRLFSHVGRSLSCVELKDLAEPPGVDPRWPVAIDTSTRRVSGFGPTWWAPMGRYHPMGSGTFRGRSKLDRIHAEE